jgi:hypothetical protein
MCNHSLALSILVKMGRVKRITTARVMPGEGHQVKEGHRVEEEEAMAVMALIVNPQGRRGKCLNQQQRRLPHS